MRRQTGILVSILVLLLAACGPAAQESTPTPTALTPAALTPTAPTATPGAIPTAKPTAEATATPATTALKPKYGGILKVQARVDADSFDGMVWQAGDSTGRMVQNLAFSMLASYPSTPKTMCKPILTPELAQSWKWVNDKTFEMKIPEGVKFQNKPPVNGRELTADDVVYSINRFRKYAARALAVTNHITSVEKVDKYTVRILTDQPLPAIYGSVFLSSPFGMFILAKESGGSEESWKDPRVSWVGSGPFQFKDYRPGVSISFEKHPDYWKKGLPYVDSLTFMIMPDASTSLAALLSGKIDLWARDVPPPTMLIIFQRNKEMLQACPPPIGIYFYLRLNQPPLNDVRLRRALSMAIDRDALVNAVLGGLAVKGHVEPPVHPWYYSWEDLPPQTRHWVEYHPDEAARLVAEAGYPQGIDILLNVNPSYREPHLAYAEALVDMWTKVGLKTTIKWWESGAFASGPMKGKFDGVMLARHDYLEPYDTLTRQYSKGDPEANRSSVNDPELDKLIEAFAIELDPAKAESIARAIQVRMTEQVEVMVPAAWYDASALQTWVKGFGRYDPRWSSTWAEVTWLAK